MLHFQDIIEIRFSNQIEVIIENRKCQLKQELLKIKILIKNKI